MADPKRENRVAMLRRRLAAVLPRAGVARTVLGVGSLAIVAMIVGVACMGDDDPTPSSPFDDPSITIETFTPTPPDYTPEALLTRVAQQTAFAQTATAQPPTTPTPPGVTTPVPAVDGTSPPSDSLTPEAVEVKPPDLLLDTDGGQTQAANGSFNWCEITINSCASIQLQFHFLDQPSVTWSAGTAGTITTPNTSLPPLTTELALYVHDENAVIPTNPAGKVIGDDLAFVPLVPPLQQEIISGPDITFTPDVPPDKYILSVIVNWTTPEGAPTPLYTHYAFVVDIE